MRLITFGTGRLSHDSNLLSPQLLLFLSYIKLEGLGSREQLAALFWPHLAGEHSKKGERKDYNNVAVALASLKRELALEPNDLTKLSCDATDLDHAFMAGKFSRVAELYDRQGFLVDIEHSPRLKLSSELSEWLYQQRQRFLLMAKEAFICLAEQAKLQEQKQFAQQAYKLQEDDLALSLLARLHTVLSKTNLAQALFNGFDTHLNQLQTDGLLSEEAFRFLGLLSLQTKPNVAAARIAANISPKQAALCLEELINAKLLDANQRLSTRALNLAYLKQRPALEMALLSALKDHSPSTEVFAIYQKIYQASKTFGGQGFWSKARASYLDEAQRLLKTQDFLAAADLLAEFSQAEKQNQKEPDPSIRFLHSYTLARMAHFSEALETLKDVKETPEVLAMKAGTLLATGNKEASAELCQQVLELTPDNGQHDWALAIAFNTFGSINQKSGQLHEAQHCFAKAALHFHVLGMTLRALGMTLNSGSVFIDMGDIAKAEQVYNEVIQGTSKHPILKVRALVNRGFISVIQTDALSALRYFQEAKDVAEKNAFEATHPGIFASTLNSWSILAFKCQTISQDTASLNLKKVITLTQGTGERKELAKAMTHLAIVNRDLVKFETAWEMLRKYGGLKECEVYKPEYQALIQEHIEEARVASDQSALSYYLAKLSHFLDDTEVAESSPPSLQNKSHYKAS